VERRVFPRIRFSSPKFTFMHQIFLVRFFGRTSVEINYLAEEVFGMGSIEKAGRGAARSSF
jgi:hypothetical protein